jgi:negative regulator of flagellin synthesis FlgM
MSVTIQGLNDVSPLKQVLNTKRAEGSKESVSMGDEPLVNISTRARQSEGMLRALEIVNAAPDVRLDRIAEVRAKIADPAYINDSIINLTADRVVNLLLDTPDEA